MSLRGLFQGGPQSCKIDRHGNTDYRGSFLKVYVREIGEQVIFSSFERHFLSLYL